MAPWVKANTQHKYTLTHSHTHTHTKGCDKQKEHLNRTETYFKSSITCTIGMNHTELVENNSTLNEKAVKYS